MSSSSVKVALLKKAFGNGDHSRDGEDISFKCPKCSSNNSSKKKLAIKIEEGLYHCWVCGLSGKNIYTLFKAYAPSHLSELKSIGRWGKSSFSLKEKEVEVKEELKIPEGFRLLGACSRLKDPDVQQTISYCASRGLSLRDMWYFKLGTCATGRFRRRVIFPSFTATGELNYYTARSIDSVEKMKYINAPVSKKEVIFNDINIDWRRPLTLVEGPFDLTKSNYNSSCLLGSHMSKDSVIFQKIVTNKTPIILALDPDALSKSHNIAKMLSSYGVSVRMVSVPSNTDVGEMTKKEFNNLVENSRIWSSDDRLKTLISKIKTGSVF